jgi:hypothetical protein
MYQVNFTGAGATTIITSMYPNISSITGFLPSSSKYILCSFTGVSTNWFRTAIAVQATDKRFTRYWELKLTFYSTSYNGLFDTTGNRVAGGVFLPSQEIYNVQFYHQTSSTNLSIGSATLIDWATQINIDRQTDDPYNQAPVSSYTEYSTNDVSSSTTNTNVEYGTQTA